MSELRERMDKLVALKKEIEEKEKVYWTNELRKEIEKFKESDIKDIASDVWSLYCKGIIDSSTVTYNEYEYFLKSDELAVNDPILGKIYLGTPYYCYKESDYLGYKKHYDAAPVVIEMFKKRAEKGLDTYEAKIREKILKIGGRA